MAFAGTLPGRPIPQPVMSQFGSRAHAHTHSTVRAHAAHQCRLEHQLRQNSRSTWGSSATLRQQRQTPRQKRGHSAIVYADQDYYSVLGINKSADKQAIKSAYRQKARKFHPDVNKEPGAEDTFKSISNAYEDRAYPLRFTPVSITARHELTIVVCQQIWIKSCRHDRLQLSHQDFCRHCCTTGIARSTCRCR